jgi:DNA-binding response OmpR family regulator
MRLLLVDDEKRLADALSHLLKKNGYIVDVAMDGERGVEMAVTGVYDVISLIVCCRAKMVLPFCRNFAAWALLRLSYS